MTVTVSVLEVGDDSNADRLLVVLEGAQLIVDEFNCIEYAAPGAPWTELVPKAAWTGEDVVDPSGTIPQTILTAASAALRKYLQAALAPRLVAARAAARACFERIIDSRIAYSLAWASAPREQQHHDPGVRGALDAMATARKAADDAVTAVARLAVNRCGPTVSGDETAPSSTDQLASIAQTLTQHGYRARVGESVAERVDRTLDECSRLRARVTRLEAALHVLRQCTQSQ